MYTAFGTSRLTETRRAASACHMSLYGEQNGINPAQHSSVTYESSMNTAQR